jgi:hypothetical protein
MCPQEFKIDTSNFRGNEAERVQNEMMLIVALARFGYFTKIDYDGDILVQAPIVDSPTACGDVFNG